MKPSVFFAILLILLIAVVPLSSALFSKEGTEKEGNLQSLQNNPFVIGDSSGGTGGETPSGSGMVSAIESKMETKESFRILNAATGEIAEVSVKDYVRGAIAAEMPPTFHTEALKAQGVAAHTYALRLSAMNAQSGEESLKGADFMADPDNWKGYVTEQQVKERYPDQFESYWSKICNAADAVLDYILTYEEQPIMAVYHAISAGQTEAAENVWQGEVPYLKTVESKGDILAPDYSVQTTWKTDEVKALLQQELAGVQLGEDPSGWFAVKSSSPAGYALQIQVGDQEITGQQLREIFDLRSSCVTIAYENDHFLFTTCGYGHGVGLSQYGADFMARQGDDFSTILMHYYAGSSLTKLVK